MAGVKWVEATPEEVAAYEADPRTVEYRAQEKRAAANARLHCRCGRFVKAGRPTYFGDGIRADCSRCGPVTL